MGARTLTMENGILSNIVYLIKETMLSPRRLFENIRDGKFTREIYISFFCGALLTFVKSLLINRKSFCDTSKEATPPATQAEPLNVPV